MGRTGRNDVLKAIAVWLLIGAAVNVGVAWGIAIWEASGWGKVTDARIMPVANGYVGAWPSAPPRQWWGGSVVVVYESDRPWSRYREFVADAVQPGSLARPYSEDYRVYRSDVGLPFHSLSWENWSEYQRGTPSSTIRSVIRPHFRGGVALDEPFFAYGLSVRRLPLWPAPLEFLANAIFWGASAWLLTGGLRRWRRHWRAERGRCLHCAYDRVGLAPHAPCPDCGRAPE